MRTAGSGIQKAIITINNEYYNIFLKDENAKDSAASLYSGTTCKAIFAIISPIITVMQQHRKTGIICA